MLAARRRSRRLETPRVHTRGEERLDGILDLAEVASCDAALPEVLAELATRIARLLSVEVCSIYLRESQSQPDRRATGDLVLAATHGYEPEAVGRVRMRVGEGLTGFAVECMRPVSVARARADARNRSFDVLDETRYPALCAVPLVDGGRAVGALVIQRSLARAFGQREVVLAASVAAPVLFALSKHRERSATPARTRAHKRAGGSHRPHHLSLVGSGIAPGCALGNVVVRALGDASRAPKESAYDVARERARLTDALVATATEIATLERWAQGQLSLTTMNLVLSPARFILDDARLRGRMLSRIERGVGATQAVASVMREYTRQLAASGETLLRDRALEIEQVCLRVMAQLEDRQDALPPGAVLVASRVTVCDALELAARHGVAALTSSAADASTGIAVLVALGLPVVTSLSEIFRWVADGDRALVDGTSGTVIVNPSRVDVVRYRLKA